jgi:hypothetical protein
MKIFFLNKYLISILPFFIVIPVLLNFNPISTKNLFSKDISIDNTTAVISESTKITDNKINILEKINEKDDELIKVPIAVGPKEITFYENRISLLNNGKLSVVKKKFTDKERILGLKLLNVKTGEVRVIKVKTQITNDGVKIIAPDGYNIEIIERPNGIKWNFWNTFYKVNTPENFVVIKNNYPIEEIITIKKVVKGEAVKETKKTVKGFLYVPYSDFLEQEEYKNILIKIGKEYDKYVVEKAFKLLREREVFSRSFPGKLVSDVEALSSRFFERLPLLEQGDLTEFAFEPQKTVNRVLIILGSNRENAWTRTCNRVDACGWIQFTPGTYNQIKNYYPKAKLISDFKKGAADHINSMMAAILLYDYNLADLVRNYGESITQDSRLEEYLAAAYNGSPKHVWNSLNATLGKSYSDWTKHLKTETHGFIFKLRYLINNDLP